MFSVKLAKLIRRKCHQLSSIRKTSMLQPIQSFNKTINKLIQELRETRVELKTVKKNDIDFRKEHLTECAKLSLQRRPETTVEGHIKQLEHLELQIRRAKKIKKSLMEIFVGGLSYVLIPAVSSYPETQQQQPEFDHKNIHTTMDRIGLNNGKDISCWGVERLTLECMNIHLAQSNGTPLTSNEWIERLQDDHFQQTVLDGTIPDNKYPDSTQHMLHALKRTHSIDNEFKFEYSYPDFEKFVKRAHESTSASPSGRHYGHYKTLAHDASQILKQIHSIMAISMK